MHIMKTWLELPLLSLCVFNHLIPYLHVWVDMCGYPSMHLYDKEISRKENSCYWLVCSLLNIWHNTKTSCNNNTHNSFAYSMIKVHLWTENDPQMCQHITTARFVELACLDICSLLAQETDLNCFQLADHC
jgi:hypothetical protein